MIFRTPVAVSCGLGCDVTQVLNGSVTNPAQVGRLAGWPK